MRYSIILGYVIFFALTLTIILVPLRQPAGNLIWQSFHNVKLATLLAPRDAGLAYAIGEYYFNHGSYDIAKAGTYYALAVSLEPQYKEAHYQYGRVLFINGRFVSALEEIKTVISLDPEFEKAYYMYGLINGYAGNMKQAEYGFSEFIKRNDTNWAGYNDLAWIYFKQGDYEKTSVTAKKGLEYSPANPWLNNIYGTALLNLNRKDEAKVAFELALKQSETLTPENWGRSYPGNDPAIYATGLKETRSVIRHNLALLEK